MNHKRTKSNADILIERNLVTHPIFHVAFSWAQPNHIETAAANSQVYLKSMSLSLQRHKTSPSHVWRRWEGQITLYKPCRVSVRSRFPGKQNNHYNTTVFGPQFVKDWQGRGQVICYDSYIRVCNSPNISNISSLTPQRYHNCVHKVCPIGTSHTYLNLVLSA